MNQESLTVTLLSCLQSRQVQVQEHGRLYMTMAWKRPFLMGREWVGILVGHNEGYPVVCSNHEAHRRGYSQMTC
jgi:hypothetical protein